MMEIIKNIEGQLRKDFNLSSLKIIDNTHLHKEHKNFQKNKLHLKIILKSDRLKKLGTINANRKIFFSLREYIKKYIHSLQIKIE